MKKEFWLTCISVCLLAACCEKESLPVTPTSSDLQFGHLAKTWDEGIPLGNATVGTLVWQRDSVLRFSLDRTDLWDLRPMDSIAGPNNRFAWVCEQVRKRCTEETFPIFNGNSKAAPGILDGAGKAL